MPWGESGRNRMANRIKEWKTCGKTCSIDHIQPLSKGGRHSYINTQLAHLHCNLVKKDRVLI